MPDLGFDLCAVGIWLEMQPDFNTVHAVLDGLKANPQTAPIPVIVVTAKALTPDEKQRLNGTIQSLMQKGEFLSDELLEEVRALVQGEN